MKDYVRFPGVGVVDTGVVELVAPPAAPAAAAPVRTRQLVLNSDGDAVSGDAEIDQRRDSKIVV